MDRACLALTSLVAVAVLASSSAFAGDLTSASYRLRGGHVSAGAASSTSASFSNTSALGQSQPIGPSGSALDLGTILPGFSPILAGGLPSLDLDGDGAAYFLDADDDGDGLDDVVETNTQIYGSPADTGTDSLVADSDGDGVNDGTEVAAGSDPNDPFSLPGSTAVPFAGAAGRLAIALLLGFTTVWAFRPRNRVTR